MSFSSDIKDRLCETEYTCGACSAAELTGFSDFSGGTSSGTLKIITENERVAERFCKSLSTLFGKTFEKSKNGRGYKIEDSDTRIITMLSDCSHDIASADTCCRAAYVRGAFLCGGSVSDPQKSYHMEFNAGHDAAADILSTTLAGFNIDGRITTRKGRRVVYIKEADSIADTLTLIGAGSSVIELYNVQIEKDLRNAVNRQVNCEAANAEKTAAAASKHLRAIEKIQKTGGIDKLPDVLAEMARIRLEHPEENLAELGKLLNPPIGKSGVNHRLNRIVKIAEER